ncbi:sugar ABC transporter permease [Euzebya sp.]|uniref:ABC transporter permease subunit n=1 Tax=Euzebya sp. TaxID=1971409 RepID=UPI0035197806
MSAGVEDGTRRGRLARWSIDALPGIGAAAGLVVLWTGLQLLNGRFLSAVNLTNLTLQSVALGTVAVAVVLVLLIGEIDLSVGAVGGFAAAVMAVLVVRTGLPAPVAVAAALATGAGAGLVHGIGVTALALPSLVVTLAGLLMWRGGLFLVLGDAGSLNLADPGIAALTSTFLPSWIGVVGGSAVAAATTAAWWLTRRRHEPAGRLVRIALVAAAAAAAAAVYGRDRGIPLAVVIFLGVVALLDVVLKRSAFGRHAVAIGSDARVAERAGIEVRRVRIVTFALAGTVSAAGGVLGASRLLAVNQSSGSVDLTLTAFAAAAIGGASLYGGRGSVWSALTGALVLGSLDNGLDLLGLSPGHRFLTTGTVLVLAVGLDTAARRLRDRRTA